MRGVVWRGCGPRARDSGDNNYRLGMRTLAELRTYLESEYGAQDGLVPCNICRDLVAYVRSAGSCGARRRPPAVGCSLMWTRAVPRQSPTDGRAAAEHPGRVLCQ